ncbi:MAG: transposase [Planctomycetia bacterium]|nr:transposase [Planctomycetia bacterium]
MPGHRKTVRHYHEPGDVHELTFSCYRRMPLLTNNPWRCALPRSIDAAMAACEFRLIAFVFMPEHVHLLVYPLGQENVEERIARLLAAVKRPVSAEVHQRLKQSHSPLLAKLVVRERPGRHVFRFWQEGPGYDRNLEGEKAVLAAVDYIHLNPVRRRLVKRPEDWRWSSYRRYHEPAWKPDADLPHVEGVPAELVW